LNRVWPATSKEKSAREQRIKQIKQYANSHGVKDGGQYVDSLLGVIVGRGVWRCVFSMHGKVHNVVVEITSDGETMADIMDEWRSRRPVSERVGNPEVTLLQPVKRLDKRPEGTGAPSGLELRPIWILQSG